MKHSRVPFKGPYFDPTGIGFRMASLHELNRRALTIVAVCWNPIERAAVFVNADGLALPLEVHPYDVVDLLQHAVRVDYGKVIGDGQFAMKPAELKALEASGRIKPWVVYHLPQPTGYVNDAATWAEFVAADLEAERKAAAESHAAAIRLQRSPGALGVELPWAESLQAEARDLESEVQAAERRQAELDELRRQWLASDARINAWLRGDVGDPPLLALMKGAA
ncbi:hypothetical protein [Pseudomonas paraeruginosa]|uniref:hypothetical protein n=1 Tax=Pseudomonas paraeruginosa TaxID=2994495 RepID=UPI00053D226B|nr:hypothetical protein [Pseudomonas paraeruginosa]